MSCNGAGGLAMKRWTAIGWTLAVFFFDAAALGAVTATASLETDPLMRWGFVVESQNLDFRGADLSYHDFSYADLDGADFRDADLRHAIFVHASLVQADMFRSRLKRADLGLGDLRFSRLKESDLRHASLLESDLRESDLRWARLESADLRGADLRGADLRFIFWNRQTRFTGALYDGNTMFPDAFEPIDAGMVAPEPSTALMVGLGLVGLALCGQRRSLERL